MRSSRELQTEISLENMRVTQASWFVNMMDTIVLPVRGSEPAVRS